MSTNYEKMKKRHQEETAKIPVFFAFNDKQFAAGLKKIGATAEECMGIGGGGVIQRVHAKEFFRTLIRHEVEMADALQGTDFCIDAIERVMSDREYGVTWDLSEVASVLDLDLADARIIRLFKIAEENYLKNVTD